MTTKGILYIALGELYLKQALVSAQSIQRFAPDLGFAICTDQDTINAIWTKVIKIKNKQTTFQQYMLDKISNLNHSPFDNTLYLDTDTYVISDISDIFQLLDCFEIAFTFGHQRYQRHLIQTGQILAPHELLPKNVLNPAIPSSFAPIQGGFFLFKNTERVQKWIIQLEQKYIQKQWYDDQVSMRELLWESDIRFYILPPEYNFAFVDDYKLFQKHQFKSAIPKIFHYSGNRQKDLKTIQGFEKKINYYLNKWDKPTFFEKIVKQIKALIKNSLGFLLYNFRPRKKFVLILSTARSGSTLLKALISEAPEIEHVNEQYFAIRLSKYASYWHFSRLSKGEIVLLKQPSHFNDYQTYPKVPNIESKKIILVRNPVDTAISIIKMNQAFHQKRTIEEIINYWVISYNNMKRTIDDDTIIVRYEDLVNQPEQTTARLFKFIGSSSTKGVSTYSRPQSGNWKWGNDDGSEVIQNLKVVKPEKNYDEYEGLISKMQASTKVQELMNFFDLQLPKIEK